MAADPALNAKLKEMEARRPDPKEDPEGFRRVNEEMSRLTDRARAFASAKGVKVA
ncbi:hypothetical protein [Metarhizobium album]|uniref:hypothetical protein n=1 Tax=Metarhizobium album TaxID=2182425 RepID=UPI001402BB2E|nr:hypothetical protein [Rhizobium album]